MSDAAITRNVISSTSIRRRESVRPSIRVSRFSDGLVGGRRRPAQDERIGQLAEAGVDRLATDRALATQAAQVGEQLLLALLQRVLLLEHVVDVVAGRGAADRLGQREEREDERDADPAQYERQAIRSALGPDGATDPAPGDGRRLCPPAHAAGGERRWLAGALVDGHALVAHHVAKARRARVHE